MAPERTIRGLFHLFASRRRLTFAGTRMVVFRRIRTVSLAPYLARETSHKFSISSVVVWNTVCRRPSESHRRLLQCLLNAQKFFCFFTWTGACACPFVCLFISLSVCLSVSSHYPPNTHVQTSRNFLYILIVAVIWPFSDDNTIRYVLPVCG